MMSVGSSVVNHGVSRNHKCGDNVGVALKKEEIINKKADKKTTMTRAPACVVRTLRMLV
jgi:hypothetical protein